MNKILDKMEYNNNNIKNEAYNKKFENMKVKEINIIIL